MITFSKHLAKTSTTHPDSVTRILYGLNDIQRKEIKQY